MPLSSITTQCLCDSMMWVVQIDQFMLISSRSPGETGTVDRDSGDCISAEIITYISLL